MLPMASPSKLCQTFAAFASANFPSVSIKYFLFSVPANEKEEGKKQINPCQ